MMRCGDIRQGPDPTAVEKTEGMYLPENSYHGVSLDDMTAEQLRRGLCQKSGGRVRRAYEQVPMLGELRRGAGAQDCPYMGVRLEAEKR